MALVHTCHSSSATAIPCRHGVWLLIHVESKYQLSSSPLAMLTIHAPGAHRTQNNWAPTKVICVYKRQRKRRPLQSLHVHQPPPQLTLLHWLAHRFFLLNGPQNFRLFFLSHFIYVLSYLHTDISNKSTSLNKVSFPIGPCMVGVVRNTPLCQNLFSQKGSLLPCFSEKVSIKS